MSKHRIQTKGKEVEDRIEEKIDKAIQPHVDALAKSIDMDIIKILLRNEIKMSNGMAITSKTRTKGKN